MAPLLLILGVWIGLATGIYAFLGARWRWRWQEVPNGKAPAHTGPILYREPGAVPTYLREAPLSIRMAAFTSLLFGELILPGLLLCTLGMFFFGMGLVLVPILITAGKLFRAGMLLLRREPRTAYFAARNAAWWSLWCTGLGLIGCMFTVYYAFDWRLIAVMVLVASAITGQALLVLHATHRYEDELFASSRLVRLGDHWVPTDAAA